mmetsp:Transcript_21017/g.31173  ORF Transcript_21017/g.31173 Transcript_21017/m.31173 type:complete len:128 (-) Transcript_21017:168-551(-)
MAKHNDTIPEATFWKDITAVLSLRHGETDEFLANGRSTRYGVEDRNLLSDICFRLLGDSKIDPLSKSCSERHSASERYVIHHVLRLPFLSSKFEQLFLGKALMNKWLRTFVMPWALTTATEATRHHQ